ncbi:hypothetical protein AB0K02_08070 [Streptomyces sp. NPDC049597]
MTGDRGRLRGRGSVTGGNGAEGADGAGSPVTGGGDARRIRAAPTLSP